MSGGMRVRVFGGALAVTLGGCNDPGPTFVDAGCTPAAIVASVVSPEAYACEERFTASVSLVNGSCDPIAIEGVTISGAITAGACDPAAPFTYTPTVASVAAGETERVLELSGGQFCCGGDSCPAELLCTERFTFEVETSAGVFTVTADAEIDLGGCSVLCNPPQ